MPEPTVPLPMPLEGPWAPPRRNGELVFEEPWQGRVFAMTVALYERGHFAWEDFRDRLIAEIARVEKAGTGEGYYVCWQRALESLLDAKDLCSASQLDAREGLFAARPHGHDHGR